jgi:hypothetical protein
MPGGFADDSTGEDTGAGAGAGENAYSWAWNFFSGRAAEPEARQRAENEQFGDVFEEMLREEGMADPGTGQPTSKFWSVVGGLSGGALGFIVGNVPGLLAGAVAGNRLGAVRDAKGKSVYAVFQVRPIRLSSHVSFSVGRGGCLRSGGRSYSWLTAEQ